MQSQPPFTYADVGATAHRMPNGYHQIHRSRTLGRGTTAFENATDRLMRWEIHRSAGLTVDSGSDEATAGAFVTVTFGAGPLRVTAPCRVVYVVDEPRRRGFAYGTVEGHPESGEELFCVEWHPDDTVTFTIRAFSRPGQWWTRIGAPIARLVQRHITQRYLDAMHTSQA